MSRSHGDPLAVERSADILGPKAVQYEGQNARLLSRRPDHAKSRNTLQFLGCIDQQIMFVARDVHHSDAIKIINCGTQPNSIGNIPRSRLESSWRGLVNRLFKSYVLNHVAAALPGLRVFENIQLAENYADPRWGKNFVARENIKVAVISLYINMHMGNGLRAIQQNFRAVAMGHLNHFVGRRNGAEGIGNLLERDKACFRSEKLLVFVEKYLPRLNERRATSGLRLTPQNLVVAAELVRFDQAEAYECDGQVWIRST